MKRKFRPVQVVRAVIQLLAFLTVPALFATVFSAIGGTVSSLLHGSFVISERMDSIMLVAGVCAVTLIWGRVFCGFICSFGAMQDLLYAVGSRIPFKLHIPEKTDKRLKKLKWIVLALIAVGVWGFSAGADTVWSPWAVFGMYTSVSAWSSLQYFLTIGGVLLLLIIIGSLFIERFFCKYLCPLGAMFSAVSRFRFFPVKRKAAKCGNCSLCSAKCPMSVPISEYEAVASGECISCLKCTEVCTKENITADTLPAVSGTLAVTAIAGLTYAGILTGMPKIPEQDAAAAEISEGTAPAGRFADGTYTGTGNGFRGAAKVTVQVENGMITDITVDSYTDDKEYFSRAEKSIIPQIILTQSTDVAAVSGATFSSRGLIEAVKAALSEETAVTTASTTQKHHTNTTTETAPQIIEPAEHTGTFADGVYTGTGSGLRGQTSVTVTVENGGITDITVNSYQDDAPYFSRAESGIISAILQAQSVDVAAVSGATFSSNSIKEAVANALGIAYTNPNSSAQQGHGGHGRRH